jgi:hypothetical protein
MKGSPRKKMSQHLNFRFIKTFFIKIRNQSQYGSITSISSVNSRNSRLLFRYRLRNSFCFEFSKMRTRLLGAVLGLSIFSTLMILHALKQRTTLEEFKAYPNNSTDEPTKLKAYVTMVFDDKSTIGKPSNNIIQH